MRARPSFLTPLLAHPAVRHVLVTSDDRIIASNILRAFDSGSRKTGLLKHIAMPQGTAMIIAPSNAIHTFWMKFPIDVAFVKRDGTIVKTIEALRTWRVAGALRGFAVVELGAGVLEKTGTRPGDVLVVRPASQ